MAYKDIDGQGQPLHCTVYSGCHFLPTESLNSLGYIDRIIPNQTAQANVVFVLLL